MLRRNAKQSGESVESVLKKKRKATVGRRLLLAFTNDFLLKASSQGTQKWKKLHKFTTQSFPLSQNWQVVYEERTTISNYKASHIIAQ